MFRNEGPPAARQAQPPLSLGLGVRLEGDLYHRLSLGQGESTRINEG